MITEEDEYFLRASILLLKGGRLMSKETLYKELQKAGGNLDMLLKQHRRKFKHKFVKKQREKLFPVVGVTDVETWDLAMLTTVSLTVFKQSLSDDEKNDLKSIKCMRDEIYAHTCSSSLSADQYEEIRKELQNALTSLSNGLSEKMKDDCLEIIQECTTGPVSPLLKAERTKQIEDTEHSVQVEMNKLRNQNEFPYKMKKVEKPAEVSLAVVEDNGSSPQRHQDFKMSQRVAVQTRKSGHLIVAAIDFGTTYSGYAYSFKDHYQRDPLQIFSHLWTDGHGLCTPKVPTIVLFDKAGAFNAFGYEAEEKYAQLSSSEKHFGWKYFRHFKMTLHNRPNLTLKTKLHDDQGKTMPAIKIFSAAIKYLKTHMFNKLTESYYESQQTVKENGADKDVDVNTEDILWVLTVPAIWSDSAKQFMRVAAMQAGIPEGQLLLALEPEAAAIFTKTYILSRNKSDEKHAFKKDSQFMVIDLGGGTVDITVHSVYKDGKLHEVYPPSGGPWGGTLVDYYIYEFLEDIFGRKVLEKLKTESSTETLDMHRTLELKKRQFKLTDDGKVNLTLPSSLFEIYDEENREERFLDKLERLYSNKVQKKRGRLIIDQDVFHKMFTESIDSLTEHLEAICRRHDMAEVKTLILVGGYSECDVLKQSIKDTFTDKHVIIPEEASSAVVKGAVLFGHNPDIIDSRRAPCTYGISIAVPFDPKVHPAMHKYRDMCEDVFKVFIPIGTEIVAGTTQVTHSFNTAQSTSIEIYKSISEHPFFITDPGCEKVGEIDISGTAGESTRVDIIMKFGDTELDVEAKEQETGNKISAKFNFLR